MKIKTSKKNAVVYTALILTLILVIWFVFYGVEEEVDFEQDTIILKNSDDEQIEMTVLIAEDEEQHKQGLMNRDSLCSHCGMLFVYEDDVHHGFWMKDTQIPLSIGFISKEGVIMEIQHMEPETTDTHKPKEPYRYALEVNQGFFQENGIDVGDIVSIPERFEDGSG
ncbi:MAG: DUF192 domain-containing protein [Candidatus Saliniplasma sp.]